MKRLTKKGNLTGKKIRFLEDVVYCTVNDLKNRTMSGIEYDGNPVDGMGRDGILKLTEYLKSINFIKNDKVVIPAGTEANVIYDNAGNDVDLKINNDLVLVLINDFSFNENASNEAMKAEIIE